MKAAAAHEMSARNDEMEMSDNDELVRMLANKIAGTRELLKD